MKKRLSKKRSIIFGEIALLIIGIMAFTWVIGGSLPVVSANVGDLCGFMKNNIQYSGNCIGSSTTCSGVPDPAACGNSEICCGKSLASSQSPTTTSSSQDTSGKKSYGAGISSITSLGKGALQVAVTNKLSSEIDSALKNTLPTAKKPILKAPWTQNTAGIAKDLGTAAVTAAAAYTADYFTNKAVKAIGGSAQLRYWTSAYEGATAAFVTATLLTGNPIIGAAAAALTLGAHFLFGKDTVEQGTVYYNCLPWQPVAGGSDCNLCNNQNVPCSLYQCKSLGQDCAYIPSSPKKGGSPLCYWKNPNSINPPVMTPDASVLNSGYRYSNDSAISPPDKGVKILANTKDGCLIPYNNVTFGVTTNIPSTCKFSLQGTSSYADMPLYMDGNTVPSFNHTQIIPVGAANTISAYVRCQDVNGHADTASFVFDMCVQKGPDITPPIIRGTSIYNDSKVAYNITNTNVDFYVNKPSTCKWSFKPNQKYSDMPNNMSCETNPVNMNARLSYTCSADLTGINQNSKTFYYIKCEDHPGENASLRNANTQDYVYALQSSKQLVITSVTPNETTIKGASDTIPVTISAKTIGGVYDGNSTCYSSPTGKAGSYTLFDNTGSYNSSTQLYLPNGQYNYFVQCVDLGGNSDTKEIHFNVSVDQSAPIVTRAYYSSGNMKIFTNEKASCEYSTQDCNYQFGNGVNITSTNGLDHTLSWNPQLNLYVKCEDIYGNQPPTGQCSIVLRAQNQTY